MENNEKMLEFLSLELREEIELEIHTFGSKKHKQNLEKNIENRNLGQRGILL